MVGSENVHAWYFAVELILPVAVAPNAIDPWSVGAANESSLPSVGTSSSGPFV